MSENQVTVQRSDEEPRQMTYVRTDGDHRHVVSEFRHGRDRFYSILRSEIKDAVLPPEKPDEATFLSEFFAHAEPEMPGW